MVYKSFTFQVIIRLSLLLVAMFCLAFSFFILERNQLLFTFLVLIIIIVFQVINLIRFVSKTNLELSKFLNAIKQSDFSVYYPKTNISNSIDQLHDSFNIILDSFKNITIDKEVQFSFLQQIVKHLETGIIAINGNDEIVLMNPAANKLLNISKPKTWQQLKIRCSKFVEEVDKEPKSGKKLIEIKQLDEKINLSIRSSLNIFIDEKFRIITFHNIKTEIEQKEIDAWIKLIRVLNHEIMNSVTPISSLTETIIMLLEDNENNDIRKDSVSKQTISDVLGCAKTILKRSNRLFDFVSEYRKLSKVPFPKPEKLQLKTLFREVEQLMKAELVGKKINLIITDHGDDLLINADPKQIEQVLINLITNSIQAFLNTEKPEIKINSYKKDDEILIVVSDNGCGIENDIIDEIFTPFFSTKANGSGIGLSLSRQIMRMHKASISVQSGKNKGTEFVLRFGVCA